MVSAAQGAASVSVWADAEPRGMAEMGAGAAGWSCALCLPPRVLLRSFSLCLSSLWLSLSPVPVRALPDCCFASVELKPTLPCWVIHSWLVHLNL